MSYNGWSSWNSWNVALWLHNDESLYSEMMYWIRKNPSLDVATAELQVELVGQTPDGADYDFLSIREAIEDDHAEYWEASDE